ncbi:MAG: FliM/FliN family flagellar motor switch protein [Sphingomonas paucimobilis]
MSVVQDGVDPRLIDTVSVEVEAVVGDARMTVGELTGLTAGTTLALDAALNRPVSLRLEGQEIARGELVAVDGRFGVRLTEIAPWTS